jgi:nucleoid-associated protein YgaU
MCPLCDSELSPGAASCPSCLTDLNFGGPSVAIARDFYNDGVDLARSGDRQGAISKMQGALASYPGLVDAYIVLGKLLAQSGETADLEEAITCWSRARTQRPTDEQRRKLDDCTDAAASRLREARRQASAHRRNARAAVAAGVAILAIASGAAGYLLRPPAASGTVSNAGGGTRPRPSLATPPRPPDRVAAVNEALHRSDVVALPAGDKIALVGGVQSDAEKAVTVTAAAYAAGVQPAGIDGSRLSVKLAPGPVGAARVEHMLHIYVNALGRGSRDPLHGAVFAVAGGAAKRPLKVVGTCLSPNAPQELVRLVKEVYPSANAVDVSGMAVRGAARRPAGAVRRARPRFNPHAVAVRPGQHGRAESSTPGARYTVRPGDTIFGIAQKAGGSTSTWKQLWRANQRKIPRPDRIPAGTVLSLPPGWKPPR